MAKVESFRFWCQKVLPLVYDDSLSYYELLCKVVEYLNNTIQAVNENTEDVTAMRSELTEFESNINSSQQKFENRILNTIQQLENYMNNYFDNLNVQTEINNKLDEMAIDGSLAEIIEPLLKSYEEIINQQISSQNQKILVLENRMNGFSNLPEGSTTGDAELADIRIGANGVTYPNAGDSVRGQMAQITKQNSCSNSLYLSILKNDNLIDNNSWISGAFINASDGIITSASGYSYQFVPIFKTGTYVTYRQSAFGTNRGKLSLHDCNYNYIKTINLTDEGDGIYSFTINDSDIITGMCYIGVSRNQTINLAVCYGNEYNSKKKYKWYVDSSKSSEYADVSGDYHTNLYNKKLICDGDSICKGYTDKPDNLEGWYSRIIAKNSMNGKNYAVNGGALTKGLTFQDQSPRHSISDNIDTIYSEHPDADYIILEGGVNDADVIGKITEGTIPEKFGSWTNWDYGGGYNNETFCGAVEYLFYKATMYYPKKKIGFIIPMQMGISLSAQNNRRAYFDEIIKIANKWHIPVLDLWKESQMDARNGAYYDSSLDTNGNISAGNCYADGQHPTSYGYNLFIDKIYSWINGL